MGIIGPMFGFMLGSYLAKIYVDIGSVDLGMGLAEISDIYDTQNITIW